MTINVDVPIGKIRVSNPHRPVLPDLTSPAVVKRIWDEADRAVRRDRKRRSRLHRRRQVA